MPERSQVRSHPRPSTSRSPLSISSCGTGRVVLVDIERFHLHTQQLRVDAAAGVAAEVATLEWFRDRITRTCTAEELRVVDDALALLRDASNTGNLDAAADQAARLAGRVRLLSLPQALSASLK